MHLNKHYSANAGVMLRRLCSFRSGGFILCESNCVYVDTYAWAACCEPSAQTLTRDKFFARVAGFHRIYANKNLLLWVVPGSASSECATKENSWTPTSFPG